ncbi:UDP-glucuronosyltransferase 2B31-like [Amphiprion ocellaris]|uniref:UDP-glucuronosyltransferase 2B31-like n=1 Tax=Amphiprion ocellaris TaxID=80972 RepID=UPI001649E6DE|nr:UDP-glucuronosyltransferase 2B31-like [Amphiprion ocellaris]
MYRPILVALAVVLCSAALVNEGKVLVFPLDGSHWINMKVIIEELHSRGLEVTVLRPSDAWYIKPDSPHYKSITLNVAGGFEKDNFGKFATKTLELRRQGVSFWTRMALEIEQVKEFAEVHRVLLLMMQEMFADEKLMQNLHDAKYDLVLTDLVIVGGVLLAHDLGLPLVLNVRWTVQGEGHQAIAPTPLSYVPIPWSELTDKMTFTGRVQNMLIYFFTCFQYWYITDPNYKPFVHRHFGPDLGVWAKVAMSWTWRQ